MNSKLLLILMLLLILVPTFAAAADTNVPPRDNKSTFAVEDIQKLIDQKLNGTIQQKDLDKLLAEKNLLPEKQLRDEIINMQKDKIALLQGNISNLISFFSTIFGVLAVIAVALGFLLNRIFNTKVEAIERIHHQVKSEKEDITREMKEATQLHKVLNENREYLVDMGNKLAKSKDNYLESLEEIRYLRKKILLQDHKYNRLVEFNNFLILKERAQVYIRELMDPKNTNLLSDENLLMEVNKFAENVVTTKNETIMDKLEYFISKLNEKEKNVLDSQHLELSIADLDSDGDLHDDAISSIGDWKGFFDDIKQIWVLLNDIKPLNDKGRTD
jgi:hypothetical protein